jgi:hypothetical protein
MVCGDGESHGSFMVRISVHIWMAFTRLHLRGVDTQNYGVSIRQSPYCIEGVTLVSRWRPADVRDFIEVLCISLYYRH